MNKIVKKLKLIKEDVDFKDMDQVDKYYYDNLLKIKKEVDTQIKSLFKEYQEVKFSDDKKTIGILYPKKNGTIYQLWY